MWHGAGQRSVLQRMWRVVALMGVLGVVCVSRVGAQPVAPNEDSWTLARCVEYAQTNSPEMQSAALSTQDAREALWQSKWSLAPTVRAGAQYGLNFGRAIDYGSNTVSNDLQSTGFSISASMTLFQGLVQLRTIRANRLGLEAQQARMQALQFDLALRVTGAFLQMLYNRELLAVRREQVGLSQEQVELGEKRVAAGSIAEGAVLDLKAQLAAEELAVAEAQNALELARINLMQLLNLRDTISFSIVAPTLEGVDVQPPRVETVGELYQQALVHYPSVQVATLQEQRALEGVKMAKGAYWPSLGLSASYGSGTRHFLDKQGHIPEDPFMDQVRDNASQSISLSLSIPIFDGFATRRNVGRARIQHRQAQLERENTEMELYKRLQQACADAGAAYRRYISSEQAVQAQRESFRWAQQKLAIGAMSSYDYSQAKIRLEQAQTTLLQAKFEYLFKSKILDYYRGEPLKL